VEHVREYTEHYDSDLEIVLLAWRSEEGGIELVPLSTDGQGPWGWAASRTQEAGGPILDCGSGYGETLEEARMLAERAYEEARGGE
jgi:hypothetical protein